MINYNDKALWVFDKDDTITDTKSDLEPLMAELLEALASKLKIAVISGSSWLVFQEQILSHLLPSMNLKNLYLLPASGSQYFTYDQFNLDWKQSYDHSIAANEFKHIKRLLLESLQILPESMKVEKVFSDQIQNRGGQITLSALGQIAPKKLKKAWDPTREKRQILTEYLIPKLPHFDVKIGGSTSVDITKAGINKEFGVRALLNDLKITANQAVYFGDSLGNNGNDAIVKNIPNLDTIAVADHHETFNILKIYLSAQ